jgi:hypothetical protein
MVLARFLFTRASQGVRVFFCARAQRREGARVGDSRQSPLRLSFEKYPRRKVPGLECADMSALWGRRSAWVESF